MSQDVSRIIEDVHSNTIKCMSIRIFSSVLVSLLTKMAVQDIAQSMSRVEANMMQIHAWASKQASCNSL